MNTLRDWKKKAAAAANDDEAVEKAFMDQAYTFVANKAGPLMNDPYRLGFEVVFKNDNNTRMVGIFAFRMGENLLYAPVFFLSGEIKGMDLLYDHSNKLFKPLSKEWVEFIIEKKDQAIGGGIDKANRRFMAPDVDLQSIAYPPTNYKGGYAGKYASQKLSAQHPEVYEKVAAWFENEAASIPELEPILGKFIREDGGLPAMQMIEKAGAANPEWLNELVTVVDESDLCPEELVIGAAKEAHVKSASAPDDLILYVGELPATGVKEAAVSEFYKKGFMLLDDRSKDLSAVTVDDTSELEGVGTAGMYHVLMADSSVEKMFVARASEIEEDCYTPTRTKPDDNMVLVDSKGCVRRNERPYGKLIADLCECAAKESKLKKSMSAGNYYLILDPGKGSLSQAFKCVKSYSRHGIKRYVLQDSYGDPEEYIHNKDYQSTDLADKVFGSGTRFIKVKHVKPASNTDAAFNPYIEIEQCAKVGNDATLYSWIHANGHKKLAMQTTGDGFFQLKTASKTSNELGPLDALVALARDLRIPGDRAEAIIKEASTKGKSVFWLQPAEKVAASVIRVIDDADFEDGYDGDFDVATSTPRQYALRTDEQFSHPASPRIGDGNDPRFQDGISKQQLMSDTPEALAQFAKMNQLPHMFEHGAVGSLVNTFDSIAMIDKYIPELEKAQDAMGRILFLFYWKPGDFQDAYGADDMHELEQELLSNFKQFGDMLLGLLKKARKRTEGSSNLAV